MDIERRISRARRLGLSLAIVTVSISLMPLVASADVGDGAVNSATDATGNAVNSATDATGNAVNSATDATGNAVNSATDATGNAVNSATDATGNAVNTAGDTVGAGFGSINGGTLGDHSNGSGPSSATVDERSSDRIGHPTSAASGSHPRWQVRRDAYEREHLSVVGYQVGTGSVGQEPTTDPCKLDQRLVCLGLLFGLGEFADTGAEVLGEFLASTGVGVIGLMALTAMLLIAGSAALAASSRRMGVVTRTG
jgi:hypothetical protein